MDKKRPLKLENLSAKTIIYSLMGVIFMIQKKQIGWIWFFSFRKSIFKRKPTTKCFVADENAQFIFIFICIIQANWIDCIP